MLQLTAPNEGKVLIDPKAVIRIRKAIYGEDPDANCRLDWGVMNLVKESVEDVVRLVLSDLPSLVGITGGSNATIWINAKKVAGPFPPLKNMRPYGYRSSITLMGYRQHAKETREEIRDLLTEARARK